MRPGFQLGLSGGGGEEGEVCDCAITEAGSTVWMLQRDIAKAVAAGDAPTRIQAYVPRLLLVPFVLLPSLGSVADNGEALMVARAKSD